MVVHSHPPQFETSLLALLRRAGRPERRADELSHGARGEMRLWASSCASGRKAMSSPAFLAVRSRHPSESRNQPSKEIVMITTNKTRLYLLVSIGILACGDTEQTTPSIAAPAQTEQTQEPTPQEGARQAAEDARNAVLEAYRASPRGQAEAAVAEAEEAGEYEVGGPFCHLLVEHLGFDQAMCDFLERTAAGESPRLSSRQFERFLRSQKVANTRGRIVDWYDEERGEYEARIGGRIAILITRGSGFQTTGGFRMWMQRVGTSEEELANGRMAAVPLYMEWPMYERIREVASSRGEEAVVFAKLALAMLVRTWEEEYCWRDRGDPGSVCVTEESSPSEGESSP